MKAKQILISMALPALFAACANDDFLSAPSNNANEGNLVGLEKGFAVAITKGEDAATRTAWELEAWKKPLIYSWLPELNANQIVPENIGFAWRGDTPDANVRTNYKFTLSGYLKNGQEKPTFKKCDDELLITNGFTFGNVAGGVITLQEYDDATKAMMPSNFTLNQDKGKWTLKESNTEVADMYNKENNLSKEAPYVKTGVFTTENSTVFAGEYIVYFPYNDAFAEIGNLPATSPAEFTMDVANTDNLAAHLTGKTFAYGKAKIEKGGSMAEGFSTTNLSAIIAVKLTNKTEETAAQKVSKIILFDEGNEQGFYTSVGLDANKISAETSNSTTGKNLYVIDSKTTYSPTLILNLKNGSQEYVEIAKDKDQVGVLAALPIDLVQPVAYIMFSDGLCVKKSLPAKNLQGGKVNAFEVTLTKEDLDKKVSIAVDTKSFLQAWANAWDATDVDNVTIETLGNIRFNATDKVQQTNDSKYATFDYNVRQGILFNKNITIKGIGTLTIPADLTWHVKGYADSKAEAKTLTIENPIIIENEGCCGNEAGRMILGNAKGKFGNFVIKSDITNYGQLIVGANNGIGVYAFEGTISNNYDAENESTAEIYFGGQKGNTINVNKAIQNYGKMELVNHTFGINSGNVVWGSVPPTENVGVKVFAKGGINNMLETSTLLVKDQTNLSLNGNSINNGEIEIRSNGSSTDQSKDGNVKVEQGASLTNNNVIYNKGVFTADRSTLTLNNGAQFIDYVGSQYGGTKATINEGGEYICEVDNATISAGNRLAYALGDNMPTTTVRFVEGPASATYTYDLKNYKDYAKLATVKYIFAAAGKEFIINNTDKDSKSALIEHTFGTKVTVEAAKCLKFTNGKFKINGDLIVKSGWAQTVTGRSTQSFLTIAGNLDMKEGATVFAVQANSTVAATEKTASDVTVNGNVNLAKTTKFKVAEKGAVSLGANLTINEDASAIFNYSSYTNVQNVIAVNGTFTRILSSGVATANPAKVWCQSYTTGTKAVFTNGYPEMR